MKEVRMTIGWVIGTLVFLLTGCDQGEKEVALPGERMEIAISGAGVGFVQTRGPIGENETGPKIRNDSYSGNLYLRNRGSRSEYGRPLGALRGAEWNFRDVVRYRRQGGK